MSKHGSELPSITFYNEIKPKFLLSNIIEFNVIISHSCFIWFRLLYVSLKKTFSSNWNIPKPYNAHHLRSEADRQSKNNDSYKLTILPSLFDSIRTKLLKIFEHIKYLMQRIVNCVFSGQYLEKEDEETEDQILYHSTVTYKCMANTK